MTGGSLVLAARRPPCIALAFAAAALLMIFAGSSPASKRESGIKRAVQTLIEAGWFEVTETEDGREIALRTDPRTGGPIPARERIVKEFHRLRQYMRMIDLWKVDERQVIGIDLNDSVRTPFENRDKWAGNIRYGRVPQSDEIPLFRMANPGGRILLTSDSSLVLVRGVQWPRLDVRQADLQPAPASVFELMCGSEPGALVYRIADAVVVNARARGQCGVRVGEQRLADRAYCENAGISPGRCAFAVLRPGDVLAFSIPDDRDGERVIARYQRRAPASAAMVMRRNANEDKIPAAGLARFVDAIALDLGTAIVGCDSASPNLKLDCEEDLQLALDFEVQRDVQQWLDADRSSFARQGRPSTAAIVVMNARSGEVLAMGGYQAPDSPSCPMPALCLLPVGSTAKPVFATAMIGGFDGGNLATLQVRHRGPELSDILGLGFRASVNNENSASPVGASVGLETFLQHSDNHYIESMLLLASPVPGGDRCAMAADDWYELDGNRVSGDRPRSGFENQRCDPLQRGYQAPFHPAWADKLVDYFALTPFSRETQNAENWCGKGRLLGSMTYDSEPWRRLFQPDADRCQMVSSGLQRNWMRIEHLRDFRTEAIPMLLGNNRGHWTAVKLAEAYSRLATGKAVSASFVHAGGTPAHEPIDFRNHGTDARLAVSAGLAKVVLGTAASSQIPAAVAELQARLPEGYSLGVFSKTGTMQLTGAMTRGCAGEARSSECVGKAFVITLAIYARGSGAVTDPSTGRAVNAAASPQCAMTLVVNLPRWNGKPSAGNAAANVAATLIRGAIGSRLLELDGRYCAPRD